MVARADGRSMKYSLENVNGGIMVLVILLRIKTGLTYASG